MLKKWVGMTTRKQRVIASILATVLLLTGCAPSGRAEACDAVRAFSRNVGSTNINYVELAVFTSRLSDDLYAAAQQASNQRLRSDIRYAAGAARDVTTVIRNRASRDVIEFEIDILIDALDQVRYAHC
jgi:PBP1b-binding outer membrane lipoprotein LpoB